MSPSQSRYGVGQARRVFFERGLTPRGSLPEPILQSWQRCRRLGLEAQVQPPLEPVDSAGLHEMRERHEKLWRLARAELDALASDAMSTSSIAILTDEDGWILDAKGSTGFLNKAGRVALMPGVCWNEASVGTNAIGTALVEGQPIEVRGAEHYFAPHGILSCSAAPIHDPFGRLAGVLDISGDSHVAHMHALGLARLAVANIEYRYFDEGIADAQLLRIHHDPALLGTAREALLAFRDGKLVAANQNGLKLFGLEWAELGRVGYHSLFGQSPSKLYDDGFLVDRHGRVLHGYVQESREGARVRHTPAPLVVASETTRGATHPDAPLFDALQETELARACRVLDATLPVLIQGQTGTGKEVFARELHRRSKRAGKPFIAVNCAALPEGLIEAELFGYEDGAFTGARKQGNPGLLRQADGGVLFLDEIGDMPPALQPRLLRVLQDRELTPLGGGKPVKLDFALVCATHQDLEDGIAEGRFRADLYYRIAHHRVRLPPLRDLPDRADLARRMWQRMGRQENELAPDALQALGDYAWPGNLRQMSACLRTLAALFEPGTPIGTESLPAYLRDPARNVRSGADPANASLADMQNTLMQDMLAACNGNVALAARRLGISRSTLYRRLGIGQPRGANH